MQRNARRNLNCQFLPTEQAQWTNEPAALLWMKVMMKSLGHQLPGQCVVAVWNEIGSYTGGWTECWRYIFRSGVNDWQNIANHLWNDGILFHISLMTAYRAQTKDTVRDVRWFFFRTSSLDLYKSALSVTFDNYSSCCSSSSSELHYLNTDS